MEEVLVRGVSVSKNEAKLTVSGVPNKPGIAGRIFRTLADQGINVDVIIQNIGQSASTDISFTVPRNEADAAVSSLKKIAAKSGIRAVTKDPNIAKVSVVGIGMRSHAGVAARMFEIMGKNKVNIEMISTSEIKISAVVKLKDADRAVKILHRDFGLDKKK